MTKKISSAVANIKNGKQKSLKLGNLDAYRDWGHARDYVEAMWLMLQLDEPQDFVIASGETHTVREFVTKAFNCVGIEIEWRGEGLDEVGVDKITGDILVSVDPRYFRPAEVELLWGDPSRAKEVLNWSPKYNFDTLVQEMVEYDLTYSDYGFD